MTTPFYVGYKFGNLSVKGKARSLYVFVTPTGRLITKEPTKEQRKTDYVKIKRVKCWCDACKRKFVTTKDALKIPGRGKMKGCDGCQKFYVRAFGTVWPSTRSIAAAFNTKDCVLLRRVKEEGLTLQEAVEKPHLKTIEPGDKFHRLTVLNKSSGYLRWLCACRCGKQVIVRSCNLYSSNTKSCGCRKAESSRRTGKACRKYNKEEYTIGRDTHTAMMRRCYNPDHKSYSRYGKRGIKVYGPWHKRERFIKDVQVELGPRPKKHTLDRINNDKGYVPGNLRWSTKSEQANNRSTCVYLTYRNRTQTVAHWAAEKKMKEKGITAFMMYYRKRLGWSDKDILTTPAKERL